MPMMYRIQMDEEMNDFSHNKVDQNFKMQMDKNTSS